MIRINHSTNTILTAAGLVALLAVPCVAASEGTDAKSIEALAAESANSAAQHQALAQYYRDKAADARREVKRHRTMAVSYSSRSAGAESGMKMHCDRLADAADKAAVEYDAMASFHDAEAKKSAK